MFFLLIMEQIVFFMEENLDKNNEVNKEISDNTTKLNSEDCLLYTSPSPRDNR